MTDNNGGKTDMPSNDYIADSEASESNIANSAHQPSSGLKPLIYYYFINDEWRQEEFSIETVQVKIGTNPDECEIHLKNPEIGNVQIVVKRIGKIWYFIEAGEKDLMKVNGVKKRQAKLLPKSCVIIQISSVTLIFSTRSDKIRLFKTSTLECKVGNPKTGEFSLSHDNSKLRYSFGELCLIGSNPICDFYIKSKSFCGFITNDEKHLIFTSLIVHHEIFMTKNGLNINEKVILNPGDKIIIDTRNIVFDISKELPLPEQLNSFIHSDQESIMLQQINKNGFPGKGYVLPPEGNSVFIGRTNESEVVIEGSVKISRQHAQAVIYDKAIQLIDNESKNGTFVNNTKVTNTMVYPGDIIRMADATFLVCFVS